MRNFGSLACTVWAVGGGSKMLLHIFYSEKTSIDGDSPSEVFVIVLWFCRGDSSNGVGERCRIVIFPTFLVLFSPKIYYFLLTP